jgi:prepilin-type N-terminal cleavage/methylation domain-containing protein
MKGLAVKRRGFTLIEIMIVVGIAALVMATAVPFIQNTLRKDPLRQAVSDVMEACSHARATAIFSGTPAELLIMPQQGSLQVTAARGGTGEQEKSATHRPEEETPVVPARPRVLSPIVERTRHRRVDRELPSVEECRGSPGALLSEWHERRIHDRRAAPGTMAKNFTRYRHRVGGVASPRWTKLEMNL